MLMMKAINKACSVGNDEYRSLLIKIMDKAGQKEKIASLIMSRDMSKMAEDYVSVMYEKIFEAVPDAMEEIINFYKSIQTGERNYTDRVKKNFYGK